ELLVLLGLSTALPVTVSVSPVFSVSGLFTVSAPVVNCPARTVDPLIVSDAESPTPVITLTPLPPTALIVTRSLLPGGTTGRSLDGSFQFAALSQLPTTDVQT